MNGFLPGFSRASWWADHLNQVCRSVLNQLKRVRQEATRSRISKENTAVDFSLHELKMSPAYGIRGTLSPEDHECLHQISCKSRHNITQKDINVMVALKSLGFILWGQWITVQYFTAGHLKAEPGSKWWCKNADGLISPCLKPHSSIK